MSKNRVSISVFYCPGNPVISHPEKGFVHFGDVSLIFIINRTNITNAACNFFGLRAVPEKKKTKKGGRGKFFQPINKLALLALLVFFSGTAFISKSLFGKFLDYYSMTFMSKGYCI